MKFSPKKRVFIISEIGNNHEGSMRIARQLIDASVDSGADCVKFQTISPEKLISCSDKERIRQLKNFELSRKNFYELANHAHKKNILFMSTPFSLECLDWLSEIVFAFKISSGDFTFFPLIEKVLKINKPIFISTGMTSQKELEYFKEFFYEQISNFSEKLTMLYCISSYPARKREINLNSINYLKRFSDFVGYSDHTIGIDIPILAVASGAKVIEKHFTLDNNFSNFRDHQLSADPKQFSKMVKKIRSLEKLIGKKEKIASIDESKNIKHFRRSIYAKKNIKKDSIIKNHHLIFLRPQLDGEGPHNLSNIQGMKAKKNILKGQRINISFIKKN